jgi:DNA polymerase-3 subunit epsilon
MAKPNLETMACTLEASDDYKVLRRLGPLVAAPVEAIGKTFKGIYLDVEATGLDTDKDEVIELCMYPFDFTAAGDITSFGTPLHSYNQPTNPISELITKITGITNDMVAGHVLPIDQIQVWAYAADIVIAHNAQYDRPMMERVCVDFKVNNWGCSMSQVPWEDGKKLGYVLASLGRFYKAHNAVSDCEAGLYALQNAVFDGKTALAHVLEATRETTFHVWATGAPFDTKDLLKARGYFWNGGEDGRPKAWHKEIKQSDGDAEKQWLAHSVYNSMTRGATFTPVTAKQRFTRRG